MSLESNNGEANPEVIQETRVVNFRGLGTFREVLKGEKKYYFRDKEILEGEVVEEDSDILINIATDPFDLATLPVNLNYESFNLPVLYLGQSSFKYDKYAAVGLEFYTIDVNENGEFIVKNFNTGATELKSAEYLKSKLNPHIFGLLILLQLKKLDRELAHRVFISFRNVYSREVSELELGMDEVSSRRYMSLRNNNEFYSFLRLIDKLPDLMEFFNEGEMYNQNRLLLNPFSPIKGIERGREGFACGVAEVASKHHFGQDVICASSEDRVMLLDGISGCQGALLYLEVFTRYYLQNLDCLRDGFTVAQNLKDISDKYNLGINSPFNEAFAVAVELIVDRENEEVELRSIGDSYALHLDKDLNIVQVLGGETHGIDLVMSQDVLDVENRDFRRYKQFMNAPLDMLHIESKSIKKAVAYSRAKFKPGDTVILLSDYIDKVYRSMVGDDLSGFFSERSDESVDTNRNQRHFIYAHGLHGFMTELHSLRNAEGSNFEKVMLSVRKHFRTNLDDSGYVVKGV